MVAVNLLPWRDARLQRKRRISTTFACVMLVLLLLSMALQLWRLERGSQQLQAAERQARDALTAIEQRLSHQQALHQQLLARQAARRLTQYHTDRLIRWHQFWQLLPSLLPDRLWLLRIEKSSAQLRIEGGAQDMQAIREFRQQLKALPLFSAVMQGSVQRQQDGLYHFALRAQTRESDSE
ncbi:PilN domain-containing protein [Pantoea sp. KPR_PJ]|uniref:PilN domain-containing protein n=1 Tax=Pantoea sp. KPR_PJ TaxID=2738375 RepID=UPI003528D8FF